MARPAAPKMARKFVVLIPNVLNAVNATSTIITM